MPIVEEMQAKARASTPAQRITAVASLLAIIACFFCIGALAGVWWAGTYEVSQRIRRTEIKMEIEFVSTLWDTTVKTSVNGQTTEETKTIDDTCSQSNLSDEAKSRCDQILAVRAFVFLKLIACVGSIGCPVVWLYLELFRGSDATSELRKSLLRKSLLILGASCSAAASLWALLAIIVASTLDFKEMSDDIGVNGGGFVVTILSLVFCSVPSCVLQVFAWRWIYWMPETASTPARTVDLPKIADLPTLVTPRIDADLVASKRDVEAGVVGNQQNQKDMEGVIENM